MLSNLANYKQLTAVILLIAVILVTIFFIVFPASLSKIVPGRNNLESGSTFSDNGQPVRIGYFLQSDSGNGAWLVGRMGEVYKEDKKVYFKFFVNDKLGNSREFRAIFFLDPPSFIFSQKQSEIFSDTEENRLESVDNAYEGLRGIVGKDVIFYINIQNVDNYLIKCNRSLITLLKSGRKKLDCTPYIDQVTYREN